MPKCEYGTYLPDDMQFSYADFNREVQLVEEVGFDAIFFAEHQVVSGYFPNALAAATFALGLTIRLRAGTAPTLLPLHHPVRVAETAALCQRMSNGRLLLGVGSGYLPADFEKIGMPVGERKERYAEALEVLQRAWSGKPVDFHGKYYHLVQQALIPSLETPPPIWVAAVTPWGVRQTKDPASLFRAIERAGEVIQILQKTG